jgi:steroid delta-isomerase
MSKEAAIAQIGAVSSKVERSHIVKTLRTLFQSYPARVDADIDRRAALFAEGVVFEDPVGADPIVGKAALRKFFKDTVDAGWVIHMASQRIVVCGQEAISLTNASWGLAGQEPARVEMVHTFVFDDDGRIRSLRVFFDQDTVQ